MTEKGREEGHYSSLRFNEDENGNCERTSDRQRRSIMGQNVQEYEPEKEEGHFPDFSPLFQVYFWISFSLWPIDEECFCFLPEIGLRVAHSIPNLSFPSHLISPKTRRSGKKYLKIPPDDNSFFFPLISRIFWLVLGAIYFISTGCHLALRYC